MAREETNEEIWAVVCQMARIRRLEDELFGPTFGRFAYSFVFDMTKGAS